MAWSSVEFSNFIAALANGDHKAVAAMVAGLAERMDKVVSEAAQAANSTVSRLAAGKLPGVPRLIEAERHITAPAFQISTTALALVIYTIESATTAPLASSQDAYVDLKADSFNPPTTIVGSTGQGSTQLLGLLGVGLTQTPRGQIAAVIPAGHYVAFEKIGTGTVSLIHSVELVFE